MKNHRADQTPAMKSDVRELRDELKAELATKSDVRELRDELRAEFARKSDVQELRDGLTADIARLDGKFTGLEVKTDRMCLQMSRLEGRMERISDALMAKMSEFRSELMKAFEESVIAGRRYAEKTFTHRDILQDHESRLRDHEARLRALEATGEA